MRNCRARVGHDVICCNYETSEIWSSDTFFLFILLHAPLLGVILHAYVECTEVINNIDTIIVTLTVVFTGSLSDIYNLLLYISSFVLFCVRLGMGDPLRS